MILESAPWSGDFWTLMKSQARHRSIFLFVFPSSALHSCRSVALTYALGLLRLVFSEILVNFPFLGYLVSIRRYRSKFQHRINLKTVPNNANEWILLQITPAYPQLYLYGTKDEICSPEYVRKFISGTYNTSPPFVTENQAQSDAGGSVYSRSFEADHLSILFSLFLRFPHCQTYSKTSLMSMSRQLCNFWNMCAFAIGSRLAGRDIFECQVLRWYVKYYQTVRI